MIRDDFLLRMIRKAAQAIARALAKQDETPDEETAAAIRGAIGEVVKLPVATLVMLDSDSLASMLPDADAARIVARGLAALAVVDGRRGQLADGKAKRACAIGIYRRVGIGDDPADRAAARSLTES